ncbi:MAG: PIN domain-containing protein [Kiritimatiellae bacterium]|nr:PIN domain-containing protein [Kiritimatiellia bacterium]
MSKKILVDTDVMIDFLQGVDQAANYIHTHSEQIVLSVITTAELYTGVKKGEERKNLDAFFRLFTVVPVTQGIAMTSGTFKRDYTKRCGLGLADAVIAATAYHQKALLKTFNLKHFPMLKDVQPPYIKRA